MVCRIKRRPAIGPSLRYAAKASCMHIILSPPSTETLTEEEWRKICEHLAQGFAGNQGIVVVKHSEVEASPIRAEVPHHGLSH